MDFDSMSNEDIRRQIGSMQGFNATRRDGELVLQMRSSARQVVTAEKLITVTDNLVTATRRMMYGTWAIAVIAVVALIVSIVSLWKGCR